MPAATSHVLAFYVFSGTSRFASLVRVVATPRAGRKSADFVICSTLPRLSSPLNERATKSEKWNGKPRLECVNGRHASTFENSSGFDMPVRVNGNDRADRLAGKSTHHKWLACRKMLRSLIHYLRAQSQGHHTIDRLERTGVERGRARRSSLREGDCQ